MKHTWHKTEFSGVRYREHPTRLFSGKSKQKKRPDRYYTIYFRYNGKLFEEGIGWESEGTTIEKAVRIRQELKDAQKLGSGPVSLREKRKEAEEKKAAEEHRFEAERLANISFGEFFTSTYMPQAVLQKTKKSTDREKQLFLLWISPVIGNLSFKDVGIDYLEQIMSNMMNANRSPRSIKYAMAVISQVFNYANSRNIFNGQSPTKKFQIPSKDNRRLRFLSREEASLLLNEIKKSSITLYEMSLLSLHTGARAGEIFSLLWGNVDLERNQIYLVDTKTGKNRIAFMTNDVKKMLSAKTIGSPNDLVFVNRNGGRYLNPSRTFDRAVEKIGLNAGVTDRRNRVVFHTLRHTFASWLVENGENLYTVKELMGHSTLQMTERYAHLGDNTLKKAIQNFPEL